MVSPASRVGNGDATTAAALIASQSKKYLMVQGFLCVLCMVIGALYPSLLDWSKTATEQEVFRADSGKLETMERRAYPFSSVSVVLVNDGVQLFIALCFVSRKDGLSKLFADRNVVLKMAPLGFIYAMGELLTLRSVEKGTGPVYVVIANMKLVVAAVMSRLFFGRSWAMPALHWLELLAISLLAAAFTLAEAGALGQQWRWEGAWAALAKSTVVSFTSVFCEHTYKSNPFHVVLTLQALWGFLSMVALISVSAAGIAAKSVVWELIDDTGAWSIFNGGPGVPLCSSAAHSACVEGLSASAAGAACHCLSKRGWDVYTLGTVVADLSNAVSSALVFKRLSAVAKYICRAMSVVPMYLFYCSVGRSAFDLRIFALVAALCVQVSIYTMQRHRAGEEALRQEWATHYAAVSSGGSGGTPSVSKVLKRVSGGGSSAQ